MSSRTIPNTMGYDVVPYNRDNQRTGTGFRHDGNGNPVDYAGGTFAAGTGFSYDAEDRLTQIISPSAPAQNLSAAYGYDGLRAWRETAIQGKLFFLYDETGFSQTPLLELSAGGSGHRRQRFRRRRVAWSLLSAGQQRVQRVVLLV